MFKALGNLGLAHIRAVATSRKVTIVEYSVVQANDAIFAWVVAPGGDVAFRRIGIDAHGGPIDAALGRLVRGMARRARPARGPQRQARDCWQRRHAHAVLPPPD
jgi:hypothetical protein